MKKKIAVFEWIEAPMMGYRSVDEVTESSDKSTQKVRITDVIEVEFQELPSEVLVSAAVAAVANQIKDLRVKHVADIKRLEDRRNELLALTCDN